VRAERGAWAVAVLLVAVGVARDGTQPPSTSETAFQPLAPLTATPVVSVGTMLEARTEVIGSDPFRIDRRPSSVPFAPGALVSETFEPSRAPTLDLVLAGILGGPPWQAVLRGVPGRDGSVVVREGETLEDLSITRVDRDSVVVQGADTSWVLTVSRQWR